MQTDSRFGLYLLPPYPAARDLAEIHAMLEKQFGFSAANRFQAHCTIKGFFKKTADPPEAIIESLDQVFAREKPILVHFGGVVQERIGLMLDLSQDPAREGANFELLDFRQRVVDVVSPFIAPDCDFAAEDLGNPFWAHFTLAFRDIPTDLFPDVLTWLEDAPLPKGSFYADTFHFLEFFCQNWDGPWWQTLTWKLHKSWRLKP